MAKEEESGNVIASGFGVDYFMNPIDFGFY
jgi:hypothetical protein